MGVVQVVSDALGLRVYQLLKERGLELVSVVENAHVDCVCKRENCSVVRGSFAIIAKARAPTGEVKYAAFTYYSHTQTDCDVNNLPADVCDVDGMDSESVELVGVYDSYEEAVSAVCNP